MDIRALAVILMIGRLITLGFIVSVFRLQRPLFKTKDQPELLPLRKVLFTLTTIIMVGLLSFITLDLLTIFEVVKRSTNHVNGIGIASSLTNLFVLFIATYIIWLLYRVAARTLLIVRQDTEDALAVSDERSRRDKLGK